MISSFIFLSCILEHHNSIILRSIAMQADQLNKNVSAAPAPEEKPSNPTLALSQEEQEYQKLILAFVKQGMDEESPLTMCMYCLEMINDFMFSQHEAFCKIQYEQLMRAIEMETCKDCFGKFTKDDLRAHGSQCPERKVLCRYCHASYPHYDIPTHQGNCYSRPVVRPNNFYQRKQEPIEEVNVEQFVNGECIWCQESWPEDFQEDHKAMCETRIDLETELLHLQLTKVEFQAIYEMHRLSAYKHLVSKQTIMETLFQQGYNEGDLVLMSQFIEHQAPIIIHTKLSKSIEGFVKDTQYRNLFETNVSGGSKSTSGRIQWQRYLFGSVYDNCQPNERVKYGVMNYLNDKNGMSNCRAYGESTIVLKDHVRKRCTFSHKRTYSKGEIVSTLKYNYLVLSKYDATELKALYFASKGFQVDSSELPSFKQVQIHGPIRFATDVECIYSPRKEIQNNRDAVERFQQKFGVQIVAIEDLHQQNN